MSFSNNPAYAFHINADIPKLSLFINKKGILFFLLGDTNISKLVCLLFVNYAPYYLKHEHD